MRQGQKSKRKLKTWMLVLGLIVFPPIGIIMLWAGRKDWGKKPKIFLTVLAALWFVVALAFGGDSSAQKEVPGESQDSVLETAIETEMASPVPTEAEPIPSVSEKAAPTPSESTKPTPSPLPTLTPSPESTPTPTPEPTPEPTPSNLLLQAEVHTTTDSGGGTRAYILFTSADMAVVSEQDYREFCDTTVASAKTKGYSYFTVDFQDGTGIVYPGCSTDMADYAYLDGNGLAGTLIYSIGYQNGSISYITPTPEPTPTPTPTPEPVSEPVGTIVYITNTGSKYHVDGCQYLSKSQIAISLSDAKRQGYEPCKKCHPPT